MLGLKTGGLLAAADAHRSTPSPSFLIFQPFIRGSGALLRALRAFHLEFLFDSNAFKVARARASDACRISDKNKKG
jgi:hypothetical protein